MFFLKNLRRPVIPYSLDPGSDWDFTLLREHRETSELGSGTPARVVILSIYYSPGSVILSDINYLSQQSAQGNREMPAERSPRVCLLGEHECITEGCITTHSLI